MMSVGKDPSSDEDSQSRSAQDDTISAQEYLDMQESLEMEAKMRYPGRIDRCTYSMGTKHQIFEYIA